MLVSCFIYFALWLAWEKYSHTVTPTVTSVACGKILPYYWGVGDDFCSSLAVNLLGQSQGSSRSWVSQTGTILMHLVSCLKGGEQGGTAVTRGFLLATASLPAPLPLMLLKCTLKIMKLLLCNN